MLLSALLATFGCSGSSQVPRPLELTTATSGPCDAYFAAPTLEALDGCSLAIAKARNGNGKPFIGSVSLDGNCWTSDEIENAMEDARAAAEAKLASAAFVTIKDIKDMTFRLGTRKVVGGRGDEIFYSASAQAVDSRVRRGGCVFIGVEYDAYSVDTSRRIDSDPVSAAVFEAMDQAFKRLPRK